MDGKKSWPPMLLLLFLYFWFDTAPEFPQSIDYPQTLSAPDSPHCLLDFAGMSETDSLTAHSDMNDFTLKSQNSFQSDYGMDFALPREVLETMTNFSVSSPGMLSEDIRALEDEFRDEIALLNESPVSARSARSARLHALATRQRDRLENAKLNIAAYCAHQTVAENVNGDLSEILSGLSTAHVLVCLERDELRRFKQFAKPLLVVLVIVILLGLVGYLGHFLGV